MQLADGTIIPSYLGVVDTATNPEPHEGSRNFALRVGEVRLVVYPDDPRSASKKFLEYQVVVQHRDSRGVGVTTEYGGCYTASLFGGIADKFRYTLRPKDADVQDDAGLGAGSKVLVLCINGTTSDAVILSGIRDSQEVEADSADDGHNLLWEFNGIRATVNQDGELSVSLKGATQADGSLVDSADPSDSGAALTLTRDGNAQLAHGDQRVTVDHRAQKVEVAATQGVDVSTPNATILLEAANVKVGGLGAVDALYKGTTHRQADAALSTALSSGLASMSASLAALTASAITAGASITAAATLHASTPIVGPILGSVPLSAGAVAITAMGPLFTAMSAAMTSMVTALATYEAGAQASLSVKNTVD